MAQEFEADIQDFLTKTEQYLSALAMQERQDALEKLKLQLQAFVAQQPTYSLLALKRSLGGPRGAANQILMQYGRPLHSVRDWTPGKVILALGLGGFLLFSAAITYGLWRLTPFLSVKEDRVRVLGGLIDIDSKLGLVKIGDQVEVGESQLSNVFEGAVDVNTEEVDEVLIDFGRGQMELSWTAAGKISWNCKLEREPDDSFIRTENGAMMLTMVNFGGADCALKIPVKMKTTVKAQTGKLDIIEPANDIYAQLKMGQVILSPNPELTYRYDLSVANGNKDARLEQESKEDGIEIKVEVENGSIQRR